MKHVCIFCGSSKGGSPLFVEAAQTMGTELARRGIGLVYGGGRIGLMGVLADSALARGGSVIGVIPESLAELEVAHEGLSELRIVSSMHERKAQMAELSDAFIALPGGFGTFEEICEIITWAQLGFHRKPCCLLNVNGYYDPLLELFDRGVESQFIRPQHRGLVLVESEVRALLDRIEGWRPPDCESVRKWIERDET